jgi:hypothetical protein
MMRTDISGATGVWPVQPGEDARRSTYSRG